MGSLISDYESDHEERERGGTMVTLGDRLEAKMRSYRMFIASCHCLFLFFDLEISLESSSSWKNEA